MSGIQAEPVSGPHPRRPFRGTLLSWRMVTVMLCTLPLPGLTGCSDFHMSASELGIGPNPAVPGDDVVASFFLSLIPTQRHTIIVIIDESEHMRVTSSQAPGIPVILELGDAADLISEYGTGAHEVYVMVHAGDEAARTQSVTLQLNASAAGEGL